MDGIHGVITPGYGQLAEIILGKKQIDLLILIKA
jgi:hypothetical protein